MPLMLSERRDRPVTFAEPDEGLSVFSRDLWESLDFPALGEAAAERRRANARLFRASDRLRRFVENFDGRASALEAAYARRNRAIEAAGGPALANPALIPPTIPTMQGFPGAEFPASDPHAEWRRATAELAAKRPELKPAIRPDLPIEAEAGAIARLAAAEHGIASADPALAPVSGLLAELAGGVRGSFRDPLQVTLGLAFGGFGFGRTAAWRIGTAIASDAAANAAIEAALTVKANAWRAELGLEKRDLPTAIGIAALFGGAAGGAVQSVAELIRLPRLPDAAKDYARAARAEAESEAAARPDVPPGVTPEEAAIAEAQAIRHAEDPSFQPPPDIVPLKPPRPDDQVRLIDEAQPGRRIDVGGRPVAFGSFDVRTLGTEARTFQYKSGGDQAGVTERLKEVRRWDPTASGKVFVFETADGRRLVADGHQRLGLARHILDRDPDQDIRLEGYLFRAGDGWTPADVRALAAKKNLQEGSGTTLDAARMLRDRPEILDDSLPVTGPMMRSAMALSRLSEPAWGMTVNGVVPENYAAAVGAMVRDPELHAPILADLARFKPETEREARLLIADAMSVGLRAEEQIDLFGRSEASRTLMGERVKVLDSALQQLRRDKRLFAALSQNAELIEEAGNVLDRAGNFDRKVTADTLADILARLAQKTGPVSDLLNRQAAALAEGSSRPAAAQNFLAEVSRVLDEQGLAALLYPKPKLAPERPVEPATPEAVAAAEAAAPAAMPTLGAAAAPLPELPDGALFRGRSLHGPIVTGLTDRWRDAVDWLLKARTGDAIGVLSHRDVPGRIDVIAGDERFGLIHIAERHPEILPDLPDRLARMRRIESRAAGRIELSDGTYTAVVSQDFEGDPKTWLLTAFGPKGSPGGQPGLRPADDLRSSLSRYYGEEGAGRDRSIEPAAPADNPLSPTEPLLFDLMPRGTDAEGRPLFATREDLLDEADRPGLLADLTAACKE